MDFAMLAAARPGETPSDYLVRLRPGTDAQQYAVAVNRTARDSLTVNLANNSASSVIDTINLVVVALALVLGAIATAAVFNTALLNTRERIRDTGILKAVGMAPGQTILMVTTSAALLGLIGGAIGIPVGVVLHDAILQTMAGRVGNDISPIQFQVFGPAILAALLLAGIAVAVIGAYLPARWAARLRVTSVLRAE